VNKKKPTRVQVVFDPETFQELKKLQVALGDATYLEILRRSVRTLSKIEDTRKRGGTTITRLDGVETEIWVI